MEIKLEIPIEAQPDDTTCGPTALHGVYKYYGLNRPLKQIIDEVPKLREGGTLAVLLAVHALKQGFHAKIYTYNLQVFDPTWFTQKKTDIREKLIRQLEHKKTNEKLRIATEGYLDFLELGGEVYQTPLSSSLIRKYLNSHIPILTGLSATFLYNQSREYGIDAQYDDIRGEPSGHFVILSGYDRDEKKFEISDPYKSNPFGETQIYTVESNRLINAILLGILTYDANLLIIEKKER
jgi:hypothetical protein